ncbi:hypothetical protein H5S09_06920 [Limosilactobacillus sp. STM2_1]|uniref:CD-NTase associated protein 4-like DNA endonuclease domain-containing protein n=1 Tax=Limosilactobacillus rudii TaxID=2759755 RepID=A0A7W3ULA0_9LACO|nr:dsDNA nuclease domain-containing protein [Limosilactobacillus rudii]MBB1078776.1 hypothetical protein [Limosilactobacillus rudii]MBB1097672.1 hypothetical protein [Limosilactobacillus rudii]MCD7134780.1 hypothetical protein [Limosilactobacillus rudii]
MSLFRNASGIRKGFNYQDMVALYYFLDNIKEIKEIKNEGEDDVDIVFNDGSLGFLQAKETKNIDTTLKVGILRKALIALFDDCVAHKNIKLLEIITNSNYPFSKKDISFLQPYGKFIFKDLKANSQQKINKQIENICKSEKKYNKEDFDTDKLAITKISYEGSDDRSKLQELKNIIYEFISDAEISPSYYKRLLHSWSFLFYRNSDEPKNRISKKKFIDYTELTVMDAPDLDEFIRKFDVKAGNIDYIKENYEDYLEKAILDYSLITIVESDFDKFSLKNRDKVEADNIVQFVNEESSIIFEKIGLNNQDDLDIAKIIVWLIVIRRRFLNNIERASINEN